LRFTGRWSKIVDIKGGIDYDVIRETHDGLQSVTLGHRIGRSFNEFFRGQLVDTAWVHHLVDLDERIDDEGVHLPEGYNALIIHTRRTFKYPLVAMSTKLARDPLAGAAANIWLAVNYRWGQFAFTFEPQGDGGARCYIGTQDLWTNPLVTNLLPADRYEASHLYRIKINKSQAWLFVDGSLVCVGLYGVMEGLPIWENNPPYALAASTLPLLNHENLAHLELQNQGRAFTLPINLTNASNFLAHDGDPCPPIQFPLYTENTSTKWNGLSTSVAVTSHPLPIWGYRNKTLAFQSNAAGTVTVQVYVGGAWRDYVEKTLTADELWTYIITADYPIARCIYTPVATDTIAVAELYLS